VFGPTQAAARLEGSKVFSKDFMARNGIPTARYKTFGASELTLAQEFIKSLKPPIVVKADGLAAGKGVLICPSREEALEGVREMTIAKSFGAAGERIVIEEYLAGEEASIFIITDGERFVTLAPAQDHKRILDGDLGKNTGGMGAYAPAPLVTEELLKQVEREVVLPTLEGMRREGSPYSGCLYVGLMIGEEGPKVLEYNCRFGDPEAQVVIPLIETDFAEMLLSVSERRLRANAEFRPARSAVCVVIASKGYPDAYDTGKTIEGLKQFEGNESLVVFHAGTKQADGRTVTAGGRVLGVTAIGRDLDLAATIRSAYEAAGKISFDGAYHRTDIGKKALRHLERKATKGTRV
jgi:phosphoribosylamine--glycine ligase